MNENVKFMLDLRKNILRLNHNKTCTDALKLKEFLIANSHYLPECNATVDLVDALFVLCEEFDPMAINDFYAISCVFYKAMMDSMVKDVFFIGEESVFQDFEARFSHSDKNIMFYNSANDIDVGLLNQKIMNSQFSVLAYDYHGSAAVLNKGVCSPFAHFYYEVQRTPTRKTHESWKYFLTYQHERYQRGNFKQIILGSSYAYHALTDVNSVNTVSFSLPGLDITHAVNFFHEMSLEQSVGATIFCFGLYDFFKEIKNGNAVVYVNAFKASTEFIKATLSGEETSDDSLSDDLSNIDVSDSVDSLGDALSNIDISDSVDSFVHESYFLQKNLIQESCMLKNVIEDDVITELQEGMYLPSRASEDEIVSDGVQTSILHNKNVKYKKSFELNCTLLETLKEKIENSGKHIYFIIPPVPVSYVDNLNQEIKTRAYGFLDTLKSEHFHVYDFSIDQEFCYSDFYDGHHLNVVGAKKFQRKLYQAGILNSDVL